MFLSEQLNSKAWITKTAHLNVSLKLGKDLSLEVKKLLMSNCFAERRAKMLTSSIEFVVHPAFFHPYYLLLSHLHYIFWKKYSDIIKGDI